MKHQSCKNWKCLNFENKVSQEFQLFQCSPHWELYYKESINYNKLGRSSSQSQNSRVSAEDFHHLLMGLGSKNPAVDASRVTLHRAPCLILFYFHLFLSDTCHISTGYHGNKLQRHDFFSLLYKQASKLKGHRLDVQEGQTTMSWLQFEVLDTQNCKQLIRNWLFVHIKQHVLQCKFDPLCT